ncbi:MAG: UbiA family prenyltransferase [Methanomicrobiales archaeon]|jgi:4-hydroxybenzoate polyprenyltransferase
MTFSTHGVVHGSINPFWILKSLEREIIAIYQFVMFSSIFVGLICVGMIYISCYIQQLPCSIPTLVIPFLVVFSIYNLNNKTDTGEDSVNRHDRSIFIEHHGRTLFIAAIMAIVLATSFSALYNPLTLFITLLPFLLGILYSARWLPSRFPYRRLKEVPLIKNIIVCFSWSFLPSLLPVYMKGSVPDARTAIVFLLYFSWCSMASTLPDIRDRLGDAQAGVKTIPVILGDQKTINLLFWNNLIFSLIILDISYHLLRSFLIVILITSIIYSQGCIYFMRKINLRNFICDILSDGQFIYFAFGICILNIAHVIPS